MNNDFLSLMIEQSSFAFAYHKIITDDKGSPKDYEFIDVNQSFLEMTGFAKELIIGNSVQNILPEIENSKFNWIKFYGKLALNGGSETFEQYSEPLKKWFKVHAYSKGDGYFSTIFIEITKDRQKAEELDGFFSVNLDLLCIADTEGNFIKVNREWEKVLGYPVEELCKRKFLEFVHPEDLEATLNAISELSKQKKILNFVNRYRTKNNSYRFIEWRSYPKGSLIYAAARDVTENIYREQALKESEQTLKSIAESAYDAIIMINDKGNISFWNHSAERIFGYSKHEVMGKDLHSFLAPERYHLKSLKAFENFKKTGKGNAIGKTLELEGIKKNEEEITIALSLSALNLKGRWNALGIIRDITEEKVFQKKLAESELNFRTFFETIDDMIFIGTNQGNIFYTNQSVCKKLGFTADELKQMHILDVHTENDRTKAEEILSDMLAKKRFSCPLPLQKKDKTKVPVETRVWFGKWNGEECIFGISKDLSKEQEALEKFNRLFENNPALMAVTNLPDRNFSEVNTAFLKTLGYSKEEVLGKNVKDLNLFVEKDIEKIVAKQVQSKGFIYNVELKIRTKSNDILTGLFSAEEIKSQGKTYLLSVMTDISAQKKAEEKLLYYSQMQNILMNIASKYINIKIDEAELAINKALSEIGNHFGADRVYIFDYDFKNQTTSNLYEWCNKSVIPQINQLQNVPLEGLDDWVDAHLKGNPMLVRNVLNLPEGNLKNILAPQNIKTLVTVPLKDNDKLFGYIGFDWVKNYHEYTDIEIDLLYLFAQILVNIKLRIEAETSLVQGRERLDLALKGTNAGLWDWYIETGEALFDNRWAEIGGYELSELEPVSINTWINLCHPQDIKISEAALKDHFSGKTDLYEAEVRMKHKNGDWIWVLDRGRVVKRDINGRPLRMTGTHIDITNRKKAEEMIRHMANHDALTGLPTLRLAKDRALIANERAKRSNKMTAFMFVDLDGFKLINDTFGHEAGDLVLKKVASRLNSSVRQSDTVSRIGGDEFLIIINEIESLEPAENIAAKIIREISLPFKYKTNDLKIGCSIGISIYPKNGNDIEYLIKKSGKNSFAFALENQ
jgi:diguanylate cyclase (GGDEF)-like protein/PAS domain S-box-containing protein